MITHRQQVTDMIISAKVLKSIKWKDDAEKIGLSKDERLLNLLSKLNTQKSSFDNIFGCHKY